MFTRKFGSLFGALVIALLCVTGATSARVRGVALPGVTAAASCPTQIVEGPLGY